MQQLPLYHSIAGKPVVVLGSGDAAAAKRRLVERTRGVVLDDLQSGIDEGARLAFVAHDDPARCEADAIRLRCAGMLVNVVDRPELCDFTTPSILDRDPVLVAVGTGGASAGLAKHVRLRLERLLPESLGDLANALFGRRDRLRERYPDGRERRAALDDALAEGGALDVLDAAAAGRVDRWLEDGPASGQADAVHTIVLRSEDPDDLTLREARLLGSADFLVTPDSLPDAILNRARADAVRVSQTDQDQVPRGLVVILELAQS